MDVDDESRWSGSDVSWLAVDGDGRVGWFTTNGSGLVPRELANDSDLIGQEEIFAEWLRNQGRAFRFGHGDEQWLDATSVGVNSYDYSSASDCFERKADAIVLLLATDLPAPVRHQIERVVRPDIHFKDMPSIPSHSMV